LQGALSDSNHQTTHRPQAVTVITLPVTVQLATPTFSLEDLARPKRGLEGAGFAASGSASPRVFPTQAVAESKGRGWDERQCALD